MGLQGEGIQGLPQPLPANTDIRAGGGTGTAQLGGVLDVNTTEYSTPADTVEHDAMTYTIPANTLNENGKTIRVIVWGSTAANANIKQYRIRLAGDTLVSSVHASNNLDFSLEAIITRTGVGTQTTRGLLVRSTTPLTVVTATTEDETSAIDLKVVLKNDVASAGDLTVYGMVVELLN